MRLDLVGGELDQVESMCVRVDENDVGANSVGANSPWGETGSYRFSPLFCTLCLDTRQPGSVLKCYTLQSEIILEFPRKKSSSPS